MNVRQCRRYAGAQAGSERTVLALLRRCIAAAAASLAATVCHALTVTAMIKNSLQHKVILLIAGVS
ncbi:MAG: hypothetical protein AAF460_05585, partial [Pseudomonadota bacterium]